MNDHLFIIEATRCVERAVNPEAAERIFIEEEIDLMRQDFALLRQTQPHRSEIASEAYMMAVFKLIRPAKKLAERYPALAASFYAEVKSWADDFFTPTN